MSEKELRLEIASLRAQVLELMGRVIALESKSDKK